MDVTVLGLYLTVCGLYCENPWYYRVCEDYNGVVSKVLGDGWLNPRILSVQSLEAHQRRARMGDICRGGVRDIGHGASNMVVSREQTDGAIISSTLKNEGVGKTAPVGLAVR